MTIDKAISILHALAIENTGKAVLENYDALYLGMEALKAWSEARKDPDFTIAPYLPGETRD